MISALFSLSYMALLFFLSSLPGKGDENILTSVAPSFQNMLHLPAFGLLTLLWIWTFQNYRFRDRTSLAFAISIAALYGAGLELYQGLIPGRFPSMSDFFLNLLGIFLFAWMASRFEVRNIFLREGRLKW